MGMNQSTAKFAHLHFGSRSGSTARVADLVEVDSASDEQS